MLLLQEVKIYMSSFSFVAENFLLGAKFVISDATRASSGLVTMWDPSHFSGSLLSSSTNLFVSKLSLSRDSSLLINVYAPNVRSGRLNL